MKNLLVIRREQMRVLARPMVLLFEKRAAAHLQDYFPDQVEELGEAEVLAAIRFGIQRAGSYALETEQDLLRYLTLMFVFGRDFDRDAAFPWASEILSGPEAQLSKTSRLQKKALIDQSRGKGYRAVPQGEEA